MVIIHIWQMRKMKQCRSDLSQLLSTKKGELRGSNKYCMATVCQLPSVIMTKAHHHSLALQVLQPPFHRRGN